MCQAFHHGKFRVRRFGALLNLLDLRSFRTLGDG
jgi:hypothetical protein